MDPGDKVEKIQASMRSTATIQSILILSTLALAACRNPGSPRVTEPLFLNDAGGYDCYRIPAVLRAPDNSLLAFAEGRKHGCSDFGDVDIVLKASKDNGASWSELGVVANFDSLQAGNPSPVADLLDPDFPDGRIFLTFNTGIASEYETRLGNGLREVWFVTSEDNGVSWSTPANITPSVHKPLRPDLNPAYDFSEDWRSYAIAPGHAIQLSHEPFRGRLLFPANHSVGEPEENFDEYRSHSFFTDDHGATWQLGESVDVPSSNEAIAVELDDGRVMMNIREQSGRQRKRLVAISSDGGASWDSTWFDPALPGPVCQASMLKIPDDSGGTALLFSNPATTDRREHLTIRTSFDSGMTWPIAHEINAGPSAYSDLVLQEDGRVGVLYEFGNDGGIHYFRLNSAWLLEKR